ncbi:MAG: ClpXP protease specificity-enhancing factor [Betaproteobacteria bacterium]|nr:ClpXP protease specificity-enhancing factor [Betaproteobacteria bacterium]
MADPTTKPYLIRAIYDWCVDQGYTPYLTVVVDAATLVPMEFVRDGRITLNISSSAAPGLLLDNVWVKFSARFSGVARRIEIPVSAIEGIYARENGEGLGFQVAEASEPPQDEPEPPAPQKPRFHVVK